MKFIAIFATVAVLASAAHADPVLVPTPKAPFSADQADAYVVSLEKAIKRVCREAAAPVVGLGFYSYLACIKETRAVVAKQDPTGLHAGESRTDLLVAAR